jgi:hypothetical protein
MITSPFTRLCHVESRRRAAPSVATLRASHIGRRLGGATLLLVCFVTFVIRSLSL